MYSPHYNFFFLIKKVGRIGGRLFRMFPQTFQILFSSILCWNQIVESKYWKRREKRNYGGYLTCSCHAHFFLYADSFMGITLRLFLCFVNWKIIARQSSRSSIFISSYGPNITKMVIQKKLYDIINRMEWYRLYRRGKVQSIFGCWSLVILPQGKRLKYRSNLIILLECYTQWVRSSEFGHEDIANNVGTLSFCGELCSTCDYEELHEFA